MSKVYEDTDYDNWDIIGRSEFSILNSLRKKTGLSYVATDELISRSEYLGTIQRLWKKLEQST